MINRLIKPSSKQNLRYYLWYLRYSLPNCFLLGVILGISFSHMLHFQSGSKSCKRYFQNTFWIKFSFHCGLSLSLLQQTPNRSDNFYPSPSSSQGWFLKNVNQIRSLPFLKPSVKWETNPYLGLQGSAWSGPDTSPSQTTLALVLSAPVTWPSRCFLPENPSLLAFLHLESSFPSFPLSSCLPKPDLLSTALFDL